MFADRNGPNPNTPNRQMVSQEGNYDLDKIDEAVLAILYMSAFEENGITRAWKGINWDSTNRLFEHGYISYPRTPSKSVIFTQEGVARAREAADRLFGHLAGGDPAGSGQGGAEVSPAPDSFESTFY